MKLAALLLLLSLTSLLHAALAEVILKLRQVPILNDKEEPIEFLLTTNITLGSEEYQSVVQTVPDNSVYESYFFESSVCPPASANCWASSASAPMYQCQGECTKKTPESTPVSGLEALEGRGILTLQEGRD